MNTLEQERYYLTSYAQNREDLYLRAIFGEDFKGFYIDVGSNHPIHHSVTKLLYRSGWHGINIDPNQELMQLTFYDRQRDIGLCCGVGSKPGKLTFRQYRNHGLSTFSSEMQQDYKGQSSEFTDSYKDIEVDVRTLADICAEHKVDNIDLLKVDVEGYEREVLEGNDWRHFRPKIICIEANHKIDDWHEFLVEQGYAKKTTDGLNDYYVDTECELVDTPIRMAESTLIYPHVVDNDVAGYITLQQMRASVNEVLRKAMRQAGRKASVRLLKETIRMSLDELKFLVKESNRPTRVAYSPTQVVRAPEDVSKLDVYLSKVQKVYAASFVDTRRYEKDQIPKTKAAGMARKVKLAGYDTPRLVLGEAGRVIRRRMK